MRITAKTINTLPDGRHRIEPGLYIHVRGNSRRYYSRFTVDGKRKEITIGPASVIGFQEAKIKNAANRAAVFKGEALPGKDEADAPTLASYAPHVLESLARSRRWSEADAKVRASVLRRYILPSLGSRPIDQITTLEIVDTLSPIWEKLPSVAGRARQLLAWIFDYADAEELTQRRNPADWQGALSKYLPALGLIHEHKHREAPTLEELRVAMPQLATSSNLKCLAAALLALTACRVREVLLAKWSELDLDEKVLIVPPERRKDRAREPFAVPLSDQALKIIDRLPGPKTSFLFYPGAEAASKNIAGPQLSLCRVIGRHVTAHGLRSTFRDWAGETGERRDVAEKCLMHTLGTEVERAYYRSDLLDLRRGIMQRWADTILPKT